LDRRVSWESTLQVVRADVMNWDIAERRGEWVENSFAALSDEGPRRTPLSQEGGAELDTHV